MKPRMNTKYISFMKFVFAWSQLSEQVIGIRKKLFVHNNYYFQQTHQLLNKYKKTVVLLSNNCSLHNIFCVNDTPVNGSASAEPQNNFIRTHSILSKAY